MERASVWHGRWLRLWMAALVSVGAGVGPVGADGGWYTTRRAVGTLLLGGSLYLAKQGVDFGEEADDFHAAYRRATDAAEIDRWYQLSNNREIKSQVSWALGAALAVAGVRLLVTPGPEGPPERLAAQRTPWRSGRLELASGPVSQPWGLGLRCRFR